MRTAERTVGYIVRRCFLVLLALLFSSGAGADCVKKCPGVTATIGPVFAIGNLGASPTINWDNGASQSGTLTADATIALTNPVNGVSYTLILKQDATGSRYITWPASVLWPGRSVLPDNPPTFPVNQPAISLPRISSGANDVTVVHLTYDGTNYHGFSNVSGGSGTIQGPAPTSYHVPDRSWAVCDLDDCPGIADGAGADPNPFEGTRSVYIASGYEAEPSANTLNPEDILATFNYTHSDRFDLDTYSSELKFGYAIPKVDGGRSGTETIHFRWLVNSIAREVVFQSGGSGQIQPGQNLTFSDGAKCKPGRSDSDLSNGGSVLMTCRVETVPHYPGQVVANPTISSCTGGAVCTPTPVGTVDNAESATPAVMPFKYIVDTIDGSVDWSQQRQLTPIGDTLHWSNTDHANDVLFLGKGNYVDAGSLQSRVSLPADADVTGSALVKFRGDLAVDTTQSAGSGQLVFADTTSPTTSEWVLHPTDTEEQRFTAGAVDFANEILDFAQYQPVEIVAFGARDNSNADGGGTFTFETITGTAIPLSGTLTASGNDDTVAFQATAAGAAKLLASGGGLRFDSSGVTAARNYTIYIAYRARRQ